MNKFKDLTGQTFSKLTVLLCIRTPRQDNKGTRTHYKCKCSCGTILPKVPSENLKNGKVSSCRQCKYNAKPSLRKQNRAEYNAWADMKTRCYNPNRDISKWYTNIFVSKEWKHNFQQFLKDMGEKPTSKHTLERVNNKLGYSKENCKWATRKEQANNRRNSVLLTYKNKTQTLTQWAEEYNMTHWKLTARLKLGWSLEKALEFKGDGRKNESP